MRRMFEWCWAWWPSEEHCDCPSVFGVQSVSSVSGEGGESCEGGVSCEGGEMALFARCWGRDRRRSSGGAVLF